MAEDFSGVKVTFDKPAGYRTGDTIKATISGKAVLTTVKTLNLTLQLQDPLSGNTGSIAGAVPFTEVDQDSVVVLSATDDAGHSWTVTPDGLSVTTLA